MTETGINENTSPQHAIGHDTDQRANSSANRVAQLHIDDIVIGIRRRSVDPEVAASLADSMATIGLQAPITVREVVHDFDTGAGGGHTHYHLVAGAHRLEAARMLGRATIECCIVSCTETEAQLREIAENLHRKELTVIEFSNQTNEWVKLTEAKTGQIVQKSGAGRPEGGISAAARSLPIPGATEDARRKKVERALKIAGIKPAAQKAAIEAGFADNQAALLKISEEATKEAQIRKIKELTKAKARTTTKKRKKELSEHLGSQADVGKQEAAPPAAHPTCAEDARQAKDFADAGCDIKPDDIVIAPGTASANAQPAQYALFRMPSSLPVEIRDEMLVDLYALRDKFNTRLLFTDLPKKPAEAGASS